MGHMLYVHDEHNYQNVQIHNLLRVLQTHHHLLHSHLQSWRLRIHLLHNHVLSILRLHLHQIHHHNRVHSIHHHLVSARSRYEDIL